MIQVRAPDGTVVQFPAGTDPKTINSVMASYHDASTAAQKGESAPGTTAWRNGLWMNHVGDVDGAAAALKTGALNLIGRGPGYGMGQAFNARKAADQNVLNTYAAQHPGLNFAANLTGGLANPVSLLGGEWVGAAKGLLPAMGRAALTGGVEGGIAGGVPGAITGAALAPVAPVAGAVAGKVGGVAGALGRNVQRGLGLAKPEDVATHRLAAAVAKDVKAGVDPHANLQSWPGVSSPTLADVAGENVRAVVRDAGTQGPARQALAGYQRQTAADLQDHAITLANRLTPNEARAPADVAASLKEAQKTAADAAYPAFAPDRVPVDGPVASAISGSAGAKALNFARDLADAMRDQQSLDEIASLNGGKLPDTISAGTLDVIRRGLRDRAGSAFTAGDNTLGSALKGRAQDLDSALMANSPGFNDARNTYAGFARQIDALDAGGKVLNAPPPVYSAGFDASNPAVQGAAQVGARQALVDAIGRPTEGATGVLNRVSTATNPGENLAFTFGQQPADDFRAGLQAEVQRMQNANWMAPNLGSKTFTSGQDAGHGLFGGLHGAITSVLKRVVNGAPLNDAERSAIVTPSIGQLDPDMLKALMASRSAPGGLFGSQYAVAPIALTSGAAVGQ